MITDSKCKTHNMNTKRTLIFTVILFVTIVSTVDSAIIHRRRAISEENTTNNPDGNGAKVKLCHNRTPCGWAVYTPFTRSVDYFMRNTCECPEDKACLRTEDDLSVSAYVYRCRPENTESDTESPTTSRLGS